MCLPWLACAVAAPRLWSRVGLVTSGWRPRLYAVAAPQLGSGNNVVAAPWLFKKMIIAKCVLESSLYSILSEHR